MFVRRIIYIIIIINQQTRQTEKKKKAMLFDDIDNYQTFKDLLYSTENFNRNYSSSTSSISSGSSSPLSSDNEEEEEGEEKDEDGNDVSKRDTFELKPIKPTGSPASETRQSLSGLTVSDRKVKGGDENRYDKVSRAEREDSELAKSRTSKKGSSIFKGIKSLSNFVDDEAVEDNDYNEEEYEEAFDGEDDDDEYDSDYDEDDDSFVRTGDKLTASDYDSAASDYPSDPDDDDDDWILSRSEGESSDSYISGLSGVEDNEERASRRAMEKAILDKVRKRKRNRGLHRLKRRIYSSSSSDDEAGNDGGGGEQDDRKRADADGPRKNRKRKKANSDKEDDD